MVLTERASRAARRRRRRLAHHRRPMGAGGPLRSLNPTGTTLAAMRCLIPPPTGLGPCPCGAAVGVDRACVAAAMWTCGSSSGFRRARAGVGSAHPMRRPVARCRSTKQTGCGRRTGPRPNVGQIRAATTGPTPGSPSGSLPGQHHGVQLFGQCLHLLSTATSLACCSAAYSNGSSWPGQWAARRRESPWPARW